MYAALFEIVFFPASIAEFSTSDIDPSRAGMRVMDAIDIEVEDSVFASTHRNHTAGLLLTRQHQEHSRCC
jgi:hypothetical protein